MQRTVYFFIASAALLAALGTAQAASAAERPNFVWLLSEDNSVHYLRTFFQPDPSKQTGAATPNIDRLGEHGVFFEHAFSCAPVCSVARTTLMTSVYAPRIGTQYHRRSKRVQLPDGWHLFPAYLRQAGYYTTNNVKEDYNTEKDDQVWDDSSRQASWRNRPNPATPFFHMQSFPITHESSLHFTEADMEREPPSSPTSEIAVAPYHPDTPLFRFTYARYHDRIKQVDKVVGKIVEQLEADGLLEDTFIFYFGDHGGVLPRSKGYIYESGLHAPFAVRVPKNWRRLVDRKLGERASGFVSFVDFGPTVLHLAGVPVPEHMDGKPFLGEGVSAESVDQRDEAFGYADRFDEKYDLCRSLRKGQYKYIRNYQAFYPDSLRNNYRYRMLAYQEWKRLYQEGKLNAVQSQFFQPKAPELLYDLSTDPYETKNLAGDPKYADVLADMRTRLQQRVKQLPDLSFFPESELAAKALDDPVSFGRTHSQQISRLVDVADLALLDFQSAEPKLRQALASNDRWERYWALIACSVFGEQAGSLANEALKRLEDDELLVRVRAAEFLGIIGRADPRPTLETVLRESTSPLVTLLTLNSVVFLQDGPRGYRFDIRPESIQAKSDLVQRRLEYLLP